MSSSTQTSVTITDAASIASFNRGPIPSVFTAPTSCLATLTSVYGGGLYFGHSGIDYFDTACFPPATTSLANWNIYYYSPAIACPSGWTSAQTITAAFGGFDNTFLAIGTSTSAYLCCPSGYTASGLNRLCASSFPIATNTIPYDAPSVDVYGNWQGTTSLMTVLHTVTGEGDWGVLGDGIPIWYQAKDQVILTSSTPSSTSRSSSASSTQSQPSVINSDSLSSQPSSATNTSFQPSATTSGSSNKLSSGALVGIGVGATLGGLAIMAAIGWFLFLKRKQRRQRYQSATTYPQEMMDHSNQRTSNKSQPVPELY